MPKRYYSIIIALLLAAWPQLTLAQEKPAPPTSVQAVQIPNVARVTITWAASSTSGALSRIYRSQSIGSNGTILIDDLNALTHTDETVAYNTTYYYRVAAMYSGIESTLSAVAMVKPALPIPINIKATDTKQGREIRVSWNRPTMDIPLKYTVYRSTTGGSSGGSIANNIDTTEYFDKDVNNGTYYYYQVKSVYNTYTASDPSGAVGATPTDATAPGKPTEVSARAGSDNKVSVSWRGPSGESNLRYRVCRSSSPSGVGPQITETTNTSFTDTVWPWAGTYFYRIIALDMTGNESVASDAARVEIAAPTVTPKQQYKVSELEAGGTLNRGEIQLRWKLPNSSDIAYSRVYRHLDSADTAAMIADKVYVNSFLDKGAEGGKRYYYFIHLVDKSGYEYEAGAQVSGVSFTEKSTSTPPATNGKTSLSTPPVAANKAKAPAKTPVPAKTYAYGRPRMANLKLEAALANGLRQKLIKKLGAKKVPARLNPVLVRAYIYGGYVIDEIAHTVVNGPGLVHPIIRAGPWRKSAEYKRKRG
ncbi:MAG: hypothetical protein A3H70_03085 [Candidatus Komeilibacteria bacterium RIFCSPLOWO2_02_FULL_48_11]|uniref:Fibronectin type-III domain-containing protein n=1 Tax=Candidatus Komeilibacteria bacterium RIFCSPLOWO2_02_FULL_48_11 TaxID=1798553 RepID=A0A1G2BQB4_9BACT|nr:MAG: hypothetical protein A3H70_03085 [Candidatus Komeilibacteria bacterium RIFCSPLOWO2_02_FULL_48_11]